jgi:hypothetical protein
VDCPKIKVGFSARGRNDGDIRPRSCEEAFSNGYSGKSGLSVLNRAWKMRFQQLAKGYVSSGGVVSRKAESERRPLPAFCGTQR